MNATQELETKLVPFMGADLMAAKDNDGQVWAAVRWMCDGIGLSTGQMQRQITNVGKDNVLSKGVANLPLPTNGGLQTVLCMKLDYVPLWLAKISITPTMERETPEVAERLIQYQLKAKDALAAAFIPQYANQTAKDYREETRRMEADAKQRNAALRERAAVDKRLAMYLKAKGADKLLLLRCLRQDGIDPDMVDYVESVLRAEIEGKTAGSEKGNTRALKRDAYPVKTQGDDTAKYQAVVDYLFTNKTTLGFDKVARGVKCYCIKVDTVRAILNRRGIYDRAFLKWAKDSGIILTGKKGFTLTVHISTEEQNKNCVCFILDKGGDSV